MDVGFVYLFNCSFGFELPSVPQCLLKSPLSVYPTKETKQKFEMLLRKREGFKELILVFLIMSTRVFVGGASVPTSCTVSHYGDGDFLL